MSISVMLLNDRMNTRARVSKALAEVLYVQGSGFRIPSSGFRVQGSGFRV